MKVALTAQLGGFLFDFLQSRNVRLEVALTASQLAKFHGMKLNSLSARSAHYEEQIMRWKSLAEDVRFADEAKQAALDALNLQEVLDEFATCHGGRMAPEPQTEAEFNIAGVLLDIVPIHADLLSANIMYDEQSKDVRTASCAHLEKLATTID